MRIDNHSRLDWTWLIQHLCLKPAQLVHVCVLFIMPSSCPIQQNGFCLKLSSSLLLNVGGNHHLKCSNMVEWWLKMTFLQDQNDGIQEPRTWTQPHHRRGVARKGLFCSVPGMIHQGNKFLSSSSTLKVTERVERGTSHCAPPASRTPCLLLGHFYLNQGCLDYVSAVGGSWCSCTGLLVLFCCCVCRTGGKVYLRSAWWQGLL